MSGLSLRVYYYCSPGDFMSDTAYMYHPHVGFRGGWGTLVMNQPQTNMENTITHPNPNSGKRSRKEMDSESESYSEIGMDSWPRFLIMESMDSDKPLTKLSPFALQKGIQGLAAVPKDVNRLRSGQVLIEVDRKSHCRNLL